MSARPAGVLSVPEALELLGHGLLNPEVGPLADRPLLAVAVEPTDALSELGVVVRQLPCVTVALCLDEVAPSSGLEAFDVVLSADPGAQRPFVGTPQPDKTLALLRRAVELSPMASLCVVQLLRCSGELGVPDALVAESLTYSMLQSGDRFGSWLKSRPPRRRRPKGPDAVVLRRSGPHLEVELNRPEVRNAFSAAMRDGLVAAFELVCADQSITSARLSGRGPAFCSGGDLDEFGLAPDPVVAHAARVARSAGAWLWRCASRWTADVHGPCVGAGVELPAFAGRVRATPDTTFLLPEVAMGLVPGAGGTASIPRRIGRQRTAYLALAGDPLPATTALAWGLVDELLDV